jgi:ABC-type branched-subunit amino acid transport system substrate-binding protein
LLLGGITPSALGIAPLTAEAKLPMIVAVSGASVTVERSAYIVRTSFTLGQASSVIAEWAVKSGARRIVTLVNDWTPGLEAEKAFADVAIKDGAEIVAALRAPLANPDFAPFLQRARDLKPDTLFVFVPNTQAGPLVTQFLERGMDKSGIRPPCRIGPISLGAKQTGERSAGNLHAAFDEAGAGNVAWSRWCDTRRRKGETTGNTNFDLHRRASPRPY